MVRIASWATAWTTTSRPGPASCTMPRPSRPPTITSRRSGWAGSGGATPPRGGVGVGGEYRYILSPQTGGSFAGFFIRESLRSAADRARLDIPETRGFFPLKNDWQIQPRLSLKVNSTVTTDDL